MGSTARTEGCRRNNGQGAPEPSHQAERSLLRHETRVPHSHTSTGH